MPVTGFSDRIILWRAQIHLILGALILRDRAEKNQRLAGTGSSRFLGKLRTARCAVPLDIPNTSQISAQERPSLRSMAILSRSTFSRGLPRHFPRDFANANPDLTRSRISSLSNSAIDAKTDCRGREVLLFEKNR